MRKQPRDATRPSLAALLRDLGLALAADDPVLCDCDGDGVLPHAECA